MFSEILDRKRKTLLPLFKAFKEEFYLAGGTALALQIGHRDSIDFDFFCEKDFDPQTLLKNLKDIFSVHKVSRRFAAHAVFGPESGKKKTL